jgi:hypothetical protein
VDVLEEASVLVPVSVTLILLVNGGEKEAEGEADDVFEARIVVVPVEERVEVFEFVTEPVGVELPVEVFEMPGDAVVVLEPVMLRVELGLPLIVGVALVEDEAAGLELAVLEGATERVPVLVDVAVLLEAPVTVAWDEGAAVTLAAEVRVEVLVEAAEEVASTALSTSLRSTLRRFNASAPKSVKLIHGDVVKLPNVDSKSIKRILY